MTARTPEGGHREGMGETVVTTEKSKLEKVWSTAGRELGWYNMTADTAKVNDMSLLYQTGYDVEFVREHHRVRDMLEANVRYELGLQPADIYRALKNKAPLRVKKEGNLFDLREVAQLIRIEEFNKYMGKYRLKLEDLKKRFFTRAELKINVEDDGIKTEIDYRERCPVDKMEDFDFAEYKKKIVDNQNGFQYLASVRDQVVTKHHVENAGHVDYMDSGEINPATEDKPQMLFMPVSPTMAENSARADLPKVTISFKAQGHVHEIGAMEETTGTTVEFNPRLLKIHRGEISSREANSTLTRTSNAAVALGATEEMKYAPKKHEIEVGSEKRRLDVVYLGNDGKGKIYDGLHAAYDEGMERLRGSALTDEEADDLIFTRIVAPFIANNPTDWLICLAKAIKNHTGYEVQKAIGKGGKDWKNFGESKGGFCVAIPVRPEDADKMRDSEGYVVTDEEGYDRKERYKIFTTFEELCAYLNKRIRAGDIDGVNSPVSVPEEKSEEELRQENIDEDISEEEEISSLTPSQAEALEKIFRAMFGKDAGEYLQEFVNGGPQAIIGKGDQRKPFVEFVFAKLKKFEKLPKVKDSDLVDIVGLGGEKGKKALIKFLEKMGTVAKDSLYELFEE